MDIAINRLFNERDNVAVPSYLVTSTAPFNIEDVERIVTEANEASIQEIIEYLYKNSQSGDESGLVLTIHGYNTGPDDQGNDGVLDSWYKPLSHYVNTEDRFIQTQTNRLVYLGYRWPSESLKKSATRKEALAALPFLLSVLVYGGLGIALVALILILATNISLLAILIGIGVLLFALVFCLYFLRISVYFRDTYRATNFGVTDLVELIRRLDQGLVECKVNESLTDENLANQLKSDMSTLYNVDDSVLKASLRIIKDHLAIRPDLSIKRDDPRSARFLESLMKAIPELASDLNQDTLYEMINRIATLERNELEDARAYWDNHPIKLSFIGHSMGGHVTTQTIRILSDVFDPRSVGAVGGSSSSKLPSPRVGRVFSLGRLILVSPDIPVLAITSGRSNFLRSSLRRFEEAYLFSNEGDLALRIASTAANYFSFPARSRLQGYRLGNVTIRSQIRGADGKENAGGHGVVNLDLLLRNTSHHLLPYLEISALNENQNQSLDPRVSRMEEENSVALEGVATDDEAIADLFTYFDCTEYRDYTDYACKDQGKIFNVLTLDHQRSPIRLMGYAKLLLAYASFQDETSFPKGRDVHGGYFAGRFCKLLLYRLAFLGFEGMLDSLLETSPQELGIEQFPPSDLEAELAEARTTKPITKIPGWARVNEPQLLGKRRKAALKYLSWICQHKLIQVAISPERFKVNIEGQNQDVVREEMLM